jgi:hypothetical protein
MRRLLAIYLIGIAVQIWPLVETQWDTVPASRLVTSVAVRLPDAATWPIRAWDRAAKIFALVGLTTQQQ